MTVIMSNLGQTCYRGVHLNLSDFNLTLYNLSINYLIYF